MACATPEYRSPCGYMVIDPELTITRGLSNKQAFRHYSSSIKMQILTLMDTTSVAHKITLYRHQFFRLHGTQKVSAIVTRVFVGRS